MTKSKAIKLFCFDCAGESNKEVTLCTAFDCPLWPFRTGQTTATTGYRVRMTTAKANYAEELKMMASDGYETARFFQFSSSKQRSAAQKSADADRVMARRRLLQKKGLIS